MKQLRINRLSRQRGVSIIEIMVSLVIGLFVVGAVLLNYLGSGVSGKQATYAAQMTEDAQIAFAQISRDVQMAGYADVTNILSNGGTTATFVRPAITHPLRGCETGFVDANATWMGATCAATGTSHVFEVTYQTTTVTNVQTSGNFTDCLGASVAASLNNGMGPGVYFTNNRYYVANSASGRPELYCASPASAGSPIAENVQSMKIWYGVAPNWNAVDKSSRQPTRYVTAANMPASPANDWGKVVSVRICLLMRTAEPVLTGEDPKGYLNCDGSAIDSTDGRMYRAFFTTVAVRNKMGF